MTRPRDKSAQASPPTTERTPAFLPAALLFGRLGIKRSDLDRDTVLVDGRSLRKLISMAARAQNFDAAYYRTSNPDLDAACSAGKVSDLHQHYIEVGYIEGRLPYDVPFDADFYRQKYADIAKTFKPDDVAGMRDHFFSTGLAEGRVGSPATVQDQWTVD